MTATTTNTATPHPEKPWYRHFWPWFIMALPAAAVVAGLTTVAIAVKYQDSLVRDDWYDEGKAINQNLAREDAARRLGIRADIHLDALTGEVSVAMHENRQADLPPQLLLAITHPTLADHDQNVTLQRGADGRYHGALRAALAGRYDIELGTPQWRLLATRQFPLTDFVLDHG